MNSKVEAFADLAVAHHLASLKGQIKETTQLSDRMTRVVLDTFQATNHRDLHSGLINHPDDVVATAAIGLLAGVPGMVDICQNRLAAIDPSKAQGIIAKLLADNIDAGEIRDIREFSVSNESTITSPESVSDSRHQHSRDELVTMARKLGVQSDMRRVERRDSVDRRVGAANAFFHNSFGISEGMIEFCPDDPDETAVQLAFLYIVRPTLKSSILRVEEDYRIVQMMRLAE